MMRNSWEGLVSGVERIGARATDSEDMRLQKRIIVAIALMVIPAAVLWGGIYVGFSEPLAGSIPMSYAAVSAISIVVLGVTGRFQLFRSSQLLLILLAPFLLMQALGGFVGGSGVILWAFLCPLGALLTAGRRQAAFWFIAFLGLAVISAILESPVRPGNNLPPALVTVFFAMNISGVSLVTFGLLQYFLKLLSREREKSERLLLNVLPREIATVLKDDDRTIADYYEEVSVLFADIVGSTVLAAKLLPRQWVDVLNQVFSYFDTLVEKYDLEKIRTIGDNYMVASGAPRVRSDHAHALARMAIEMNRYIGSGPDLGDVTLQFRIGMNSGPVVAGVIGTKKFHYDIWGDAVNTASRMESHGMPGKIQITKETYHRIKDSFVCTPRGYIDVKGKGEMETWFLEDARA